MMNDFNISDKEMENVRIIAATYDTGNYEGSAMVVFRKEGKLYEVHGSHCSCYGLEDNWNPEETSYEALMDRYAKAEDYQRESYGNEFVDGLKKGLIDEMFDREVLLNNAQM